MKIDRRRFIEKTSTAFSGLILLNSAKVKDDSVFMNKNQATDYSLGIIDCQSHIFSEELVAIMEKRDSDPMIFTKDGKRYLKMGDWLRIIPPSYLDIEIKLASMNAAGISQTALSINDPGPEWFGKDGPKVAKIANDFIAGIVKKYPKRFFGLCVLPWQDVSASLKELDRCANQLGMKGLLLYTNLAGRFPDELEFRPVLIRAVELGLPVLLHPAKPLTTNVVKGYEMASSLGNMFDDTIALTRFIMSGILDELPDFKLVCPHLGGTLTFIIGRIDHQVTVLKRGPQNLKRKPSEYLNSIWFDIVSPLPEAMKFVVDFIGTRRLLYSSDSPWVDPKQILNNFRSLKLPIDDENRVLRYNALKLFQL
jgi:predicted TIM-barrel fold metal-dependent hydrolase